MQELYGNFIIRADIVRPRDIDLDALNDFVDDDIDSFDDALSLPRRAFRRRGSNPWLRDIDDINDW